MKRSTRPHVNGRRQTRPSAPPPAEAKQRTPPPSPSPRAPPFGRLVLAALSSVGVEFASLDLLRRAKKDALNEREYRVMWQLLHDIVVVVLLDFQVDKDAMKREAAASLGSADDDQLAIWQELTRFYLYDWGFVCGSFYEASPVPASVLLLALAWLLAHSRFFERQHLAILHLYMGGAAVTLPPYPNDVALADEPIRFALSDVTNDHQKLLEHIADEPSSVELTGLVNQVQAMVGRIRVHVRSLQSSLRYHERMLSTLREKQVQAGVITTGEGEQLLPAYALQVFEASKSQLDLHTRAISERLQMLEEEKLFYKWINGLILQYAPRDAGTMDRDIKTLATRFGDLFTDATRTQALLQQYSSVCQQIAELYAAEKKKWQQKAKTRTQQVKMEEKMEKLRLEIGTTELFDVQTLFLGRQTKGTATNAPVRPSTAPVQTLVREADLERLQGQLERVIHEITTQYCQMELR